ncbi:MAG: SpoIID/LytB domain-containing protein [Muribaculaceae bacterium]|nr:SpoIID/LytB domain-containing protein [Muribaculaceae bacterium]
MLEPFIRVGILSAPVIDIVLTDMYTVDGHQVRGPQTISRTPDGRIAWQGKEYDTLEFHPYNSDGTFEIKDVIIGVNFHWERKEDQRFAGSARFIVEGDNLTIINILPVESYLLSVISSEMSANASLELLKAHAVISRSWLLAQIEKNKNIAETGEHYVACTETETERVKWYDREDHINFDVCADDHCQRYQGVTRQTTPKVAEAIAATRGQVLKYEGVLCDARFSKCCGGVFEEFENCWEPKHYHYLGARADNVDENSFPNLKDEATAVSFIMSRPDAFCNTNDEKILSQVLNNYDQETTDFYRWKVEYTADEISEIAYRRSGIDFGTIIDLVPIERGTSGRLVRLKIVGTKTTKIIGKELEIRKALSYSHLYSSAFTVEKQDINPETGAPGKFILYGAGWGHGVGLCQIGAAVMGAKGYDYRAILSHYFIDSDVETLYE